MRTFDSDNARAGSLLVFSEVVTCPDCGAEQEGMFAAAGDSVEDLTDPPTGEHECACGRRWCSTATGWSTYGEAG